MVQDARARGPVHAFWSLGDMVGYGPDPGPCLKFLQEEGAVAVPGNHDLAAIGRISLSDFNHFAAAACRWTAERLSTAEAEFIRQLPLRVEEGPFTLVHGSPRDPVWEYLHTEETAAANLAFFSTLRCLVGHTHVPLVFVAEEAPKGNPLCRGFRLTSGQSFVLGAQRCLYNPGGVGQPRDGDPRASYAIYDEEAASITHYRVPYDIAATQRRMAEAGLSAYLIQRLAVGR